MKFNDKVCCVVDTGGLFVSWALRLAREFGEVYYHNTAWKSLSPRSNELLVGHGFDEITMVRDFWDIVPKIDLYVFQFIYLGDWQRELIRQGKRVWGSNRGEELELFRPEAKEEMRRLGMPVGDYEVVLGLTNLRLYLQKHPNVYVKFSLTRGDGESFHSQSYDEIKDRLREIEHELGEASEFVSFTVEAPIEPALELGFDGYCVTDNNGIAQFPTVACNAVEIKDSSCIGVMLPYESLEPRVRQVNEWLSPYLGEVRYRGNMSTEIRIGPDETPILIDFTARSGSPPGEALQEVVENWAEVMWAGAEGICVDPEPSAKYFAMCSLYGERADENWQSVRVADEAKRWVKLFFHTRLGDGLDYVAPQFAKFSEIGWVVGVGKTVKQAIRECQRHCDMVSGHQLTAKTAALQEAVSEIEKAERNGIFFSDEKIKA
jgi:hypothetical protein